MVSDEKRHDLYSLLFRFEHMHTVIFQYLYLYVELQMSSESSNKPICCHKKIVYTLLCCFFFGCLCKGHEYFGKNFVQVGNFGPLIVALSRSNLSDLLLDQRWSSFFLVPRDDRRCRRADCRWSDSQWHLRTCERVSGSPQDLVLHSALTIRVSATKSCSGAIIQFSLHSSLNNLQCSLFFFFFVSLFQIRGVKARICGKEKAVWGNLWMRECLLICES